MPLESQGQRESITEAGSLNDELPGTSKELQFRYSSDLGLKGGKFSNNAPKFARIKLGA